MSAAVRPRAWTALLALLAVLESVWATLGVSGTGDYPSDGGPALDALRRGDLHGLATAGPAMGTLSLLVRAPFTLLASPGAAHALDTYRWGVLPCALAMGILGVWLAGLARARGAAAAGQVAIVVLAVVNPLVGSALALGHPEELLTAALATAAVVCALDGRRAGAIVTLGLALACKQWAVIAVAPVILALGQGRLRALAGAAAVAALVTVPQVIGSPAAFLHTQLALAHEHYLNPSAYSWLYPLAPSVSLHLASGATASVAQLPSALVGLLHELIVALGAGVVAIAARHGRARHRDALLGALSAALLLRCTLDTETMPYYHLALLATLLAWDSLSGSRLPVRALAGTAVSYVLFDRLTPTAVGTSAASALYGAAAVAALAVLLRAGRLAAPGAGENGPQCAPPSSASTAASRWSRIFPSRVSARMESSSTSSSAA